MSSCERILFNIVCQTANLMFTASFFCDEILSFLLNSSYPFTFPCAVPSSPLGYFSSFPLAVSLWHREGEERKRGCVCWGVTQYKTLRLRKRLCKHTLSLLYICFSLFLSLKLSFTSMHTLAHFILSSSLLPLPSLILFITECNSVHQTMGSTFGESVWECLHACVCERAYACDWDRADVGSVWKRFPASPPYPVSQLSKPGAHRAGQAYESVCMRVSFTLRRSSTHLGS